MQVHIDRNGERFGPYSLEEVNAYLANGTLLPTDLAWHDGMADWVPISQITGVTIAGGSPPPPPVAGNKTEKESVNVHEALNQALGLTQALGAFMENDKRIIFACDDLVGTFKKRDDLTSALQLVRVGARKGLLSGDEKSLNYADAYIAKHVDIAPEDKQAVREINEEAQNPRIKVSEKISDFSEAQRDIIDKEISRLLDIAAESGAEAVMGEVLGGMRRGDYYLSACEYDPHKIALFKKYANMSNEQVRRFCSENGIEPPADIFINYPQ